MGLLRDHPDFRRLWVGDVLSKAGSQVLLLAVPVLAATTLDASTWQVGLLSALAGLPYLLFGLPIGAWSDRVRRRPVLVAADAARAVALAWIPLAALIGVLAIEQLYAVQFVAGTAAAVFDVSLGAYLPFLVGRGRLVEANGALEANRAVTFTLGPGLAGQLVAWLGAATAVVASVAGFLWSALWLGLIRSAEPVRPPAPSRHLGREIREGIRLTLGQPFIRATTLHATSVVLFLSMRYAIETLFLLRTVGLLPSTIGLLMVGPGVGSVAGAATAARIARRAGRVRAVLLAGLVMGAAGLLIPLAADGARLACYVVGAAVVSFSIAVTNVTAASLRQVLCPDELLGRMNATSRFLAWATLPLGGIAGGALGTVLGLRAALWVAAAGAAASAFWLLSARVMRARDLAAEAD